jgi:hypothetical protein
MFSAVVTSASATGCSAPKLAVGHGNSQVVSTKGAVSAGMPIGESSTAMAALPVALTITVIGVGVDAGAAAAAVLALSAAGHVAAQIAFAVCAVVAIRRRNLGQGLMAGVLGYAGMSLLLEGLPAMLAAAAAIPALLAGPRLVASREPSSRSQVARRRARPEVLCLVAALIVGGAMVTSRLAGPSAAGAIAAFPVMSATLAIALGRSGGRLAAAWALQGLVRSLPCYLTFCLVVATTARSLPLPWSIALALTASVITGRLTWKRVPVAVTPAPAPVSSREKVQSQPALAGFRGLR